MHKDNLDPLSDELVTEEEPRNWKGICIAFFVISFIISLILTAISILSSTVNVISFPKPNLDQLLAAQKDLQPPLQHAQWISNTELAMIDAHHNLVLFDALSNKSHQLVLSASLMQISTEHFWLSADRQFVLLQHHSKQEPGSRFLARYQLLNLTDHQLRPLHAPDGSSLLQHVQWGSRGSQLLLVHQNDLFYASSASAVWLRLTSSGSATRSNGVADWLYSKRLLRSRTALRWSPDGEKLLFASFDDRHLPVTTFPRYDLFEPQPSAQSAPLASLRFPKPGSANPLVELWVLQLDEATSTSQPIPQKVLPPKQLLATENSIPYLNAMLWVDSERFAAVWTNRDQNYSVLSLCAQNRAWNCEKHLDQTAEVGHVLPTPDAPLLSSDGRHFLLKLASPSRSDAVQQLTMITVNGRIKNVLAQQQVRVLQLLAHRVDSRTVYFLGQPTDDPSQTHVYALPDVHSSQPRISRCVTCSSETSNCSVYRAEFSVHVDYMLLHCLGPGAPWSELRTVQSDAVVLHRDAPETLRKLIGKFSLPQTRRISYSLDSKNEVDLLVNIPTHVSEQIGSIPLLIEIMPRDLSYDEPAMERQLRLDLLSYLASVRNMATARMRIRRRYDANGSACGKRHCCSHGPTCELLLLQAGLAGLRQRLPFARPERTALLGRGLGAYLVGQLLAQGYVHSNCTLLIAPIVDWMQVDSFLGERLFGQPWAAANLLAYERAELSRKANFLRATNLLLVHGTADDEVHLQHSFALMKALNQHAAVYRSQLYPDAGHSLEEVSSHLYRTIELFIAEQLRLSP